MGDEERDSRLRDMNRGMVSIYKQKLGRGPVQATTEITDHMVVSLISGSMLVAEHTLVEEGKSDLVRQMRRTYQETMRADIEALAKEVFGKESRSFLSDHDVEADLAAEIVVF